MMRSANTRPAALWTAARHFFDTHHGRETQALDIREPDKLLDAARSQIAAAVSRLLQAPDREARRKAESEITSLAAGAASVHQETFAPAWVTAAAPLRQPSLTRIYSEACDFIGAHSKEVRRLANALGGQKILSPAMVEWVAA